MYANVRLRFAVPPQSRPIAVMATHPSWPNKRVYSSYHSLKRELGIWIRQVDKSKSFVHGRTGITITHI